MRLVYVRNIVLSAIAVFAVTIGVARAQDLSHDQKATFEASLKKGAEILKVVKSHERSRLDHMLRSGLDPNTFYPYLGSTFHIVARYGDRPTMDLLIRNKGNINAASEDNFTPFLAACQNRDAEFLSYMIEKGADAHIRDRDGNDGLRVAVTAGNAKAVRYLLKQGFNPDDVGGPLKASVLYDAVLHNCRDCVIALRQAGAKDAGIDSGGPRIESICGRPSPAFADACAAAER